MVRLPLVAASLVVVSLFALCYAALFIYFAWEDLCALARRLAVAVGFTIYMVMILCMAIVILLGLFGCEQRRNDEGTANKTAYERYLQIGERKETRNISSLANAEDRFDRLVLQAADGDLDTFRRIMDAEMEQSRRERSNWSPTMKRWCNYRASWDSPRDTWCACKDIAGSWTGVCKEVTPEGLDLNKEFALAKASTREWVLRHPHLIGFNTSFELHGIQYRHDGDRLCRTSDDWCEAIDEAPTMFSR